MMIFDEEENVDVDGLNTDADADALDDDDNAECDMCYKHDTTPWECKYCVYPYRTRDKGDYWFPDHTRGWE